MTTFEPLMLMMLGVVVVTTAAGCGSGAFQLWRTALRTQYRTLEAASASAFGFEGAVRPLAHGGTVKARMKSTLSVETSDVLDFREAKTEPSRYHSEAPGAKTAAFFAKRREKRKMMHSTGLLSLRDM